MIHIGESTADELEEDKPLLKAAHMTCISRSVSRLR